MSITVARIVDYLRYVAPLVVIWILWPASLLAVWKLTEWASYKRHQEWMHLYGDEALREEIQRLRRKLLYSENRRTELDTALKAARARNRAAVLQAARLSEILVIGDEEK